MIPDTHWPYRPKGTAAMSDTNSEVITNGNGSSTKVSALTKLLKACEGKKVNEADKRKITNDFVKAQGERKKLQDALDAFDAKADDTAVNMVRCYGAEHVTIAGVVYVPTSRGDRVYYKRMGGAKQPIALD
jgi:hypothetical protein